VRPPDAEARLTALHGELAECRACPKMQGTPVHGPPVVSRILLVGQAPGPREAALGRPFAWTAGRTLFSWFEQALGCTEATFRERVYIAAMARCFPGKAAGGGDRRPDPAEIGRCSAWLSREVALLTPSLIIPVGTLAIEHVLAVKGPLVDVVGKRHRVTFLGQAADAIPLPHPSGASTWHRMEPGKALLQQALALLAAHADVRRAFPSPG
jgi:uracil-DNA glycosylase